MPPTTSIPTVFVSYSHDSSDHKDWVRGLADFLAQNGVHVVLDQWDAQLGDDLPTFMEQAITTSGRVLVVCTDNYIKKANVGSGGVGYEKRIATSELMKQHGRGKFIPIVRNVSGPDRLPTFLGATLYADFSDGANISEERARLLKAIHGVSDRPALGANPFSPTQRSGRIQQDHALPRMPAANSSAFFEARFRQAFPGLRGMASFDTLTEIEMRLGKLLEQPLTFSNAQPIWWWRDGNLNVENFSSRGSGLFLMDVHELQIRKITAVNKGSYFRWFVYVEADGMRPTGLYGNVEDARSRVVDLLGYRAEEYGVFNGKHLVTRAEYDDGSTVIEGRLVDIRASAELRVRYLTPYNFLLAAQGSVVNQPNFDERLVELLNDMLVDGSHMNELVDELSRLPRHPMRT